MKCDELLVFLESKSPARRLRAKRHLRRCEACRSAEAQWRLVQRELTATVAPSEALRRAWMSAMPADAPAAARPGVPAWALAAAAVVVAGLGLWAFLQRSPDSGPEIAHRPEAADLPDAVQDLVAPPGTETSGIAQGLRRLSQDLESLRRQVETLDERRALDELVAAQWNRFPVSP